MLKIIQLSDIHGADYLIEEIKTGLGNADIVILPGDITHFGDQISARRLIEKIAVYNKNILAVPGNCDHHGVKDYLDEKGFGIDQKIILRNGFLWTGIGGSLPCPGYTPSEYSEQDFEDQLNQTAGKLEPSLPFVLVIHQPPFNTCNDLLPDGRHVGSHAVRKFIESTSPLLCLTAHIHEGIGTDLIDTCTVVNPGPFRTGRYALITISGENSVNVQFRQITV
jgi:uncharacterized protein